MWQANYKKNVIIEQNTINNSNTYDSNSEKDVFWVFNHINS